MKCESWTKWYSDIAALLPAGFFGVEKPHNSVATINGGVDRKAIANSLLPICGSRSDDFKIVYN